MIIKFFSLVCNRLEPWNQNVVCYSKNVFKKSQNTDSIHPILHSRQCNAKQTSLMILLLRTFKVSLVTKCEKLGKPKTLKAFLLYFWNWSFFSLTFSRTTQVVTESKYLNFFFFCITAGCNVYKWEILGLFSLFLSLNVELIAAAAAVLMIQSFCFIFFYYNSCCIVTCCS